MSKDKLTLKEAMAAIRDKYGEGAILTAEKSQEKVETMPSGSFAIDNLLGNGIPRGRIIELYGEPSQGKSTISLFFAAQVQKNGGTVAYLDAENAYDATYAAKLGVDTSKILVSQPETLEEAFDIIKMYSETNAIDMIIVDSVASLVPKSELEGDDMLKETMAVQARLLSKALRIITGPVAKSKTTVIFINQTRSKVGVFYGQKETTPGGKALKYYASVRLSVAKIEKIEGPNKEQIGAKLKITAVKNKCAFPFRSGTIDLYFESGIDLCSDTLDRAIEVGVIEKNGNTYSFKGNKLGVGRDNAKKYILKDEDLYKEIRNEILEWQKKLTKN